MPFLHEPEVSLEEVRLRSLSISSLELDVAIRVKNKNPLGVTVQEVSFKVLCRDCATVRQIATGNTGRVTIKANDSTLITVPVRSDNAILLAALAALAAQGIVQVTIKGTAVVDAILFHWSVPFEKTLPVTMDQIVRAAAMEGKK
ncbi:NDR1/HIN1-like protein [Methanoregula formicica]|uniref:Conserved secreted protein n=1 Tax=Methanoregula formicica (strain DSM 22288 / NBRC 105244 / SMSP) TaxID=593750 RepID=L0H918_METFS|nr:LEA type 2 family protein [Methanoregula formicica]AGB01212.1 conserved secreted protein [Methanoregula formicica SMSP]